MCIASFLRCPRRPGNCVCFAPPCSVRLALAVSRSGLLACLLLGACAPRVSVDAGESDRAVAEFDPANKIVPFPNDLALVDGHPDLPPVCVPSGVARTLHDELEKLDGFAAFKPNLQATFNRP